MPDNSSICGRAAIVLLAVAPAVISGPAAATPIPRHQADLPNILWLTSEDNGPHIGAYGDRFADTPNLDALAARGIIYTTAWSNAPVCGPARSTIITGVYPTALGSQHMRSRVRLPEHMDLFPRFLRDAGYYTTNNAKTDYNLVLGDEPTGAPLREQPRFVAAWNESSATAHWRNRPSGAPFFAVFNSNTTHESQIRRRPHQAVHDPSGVRVPAYHPDIPEVRRDWAQYYDKMTEMDAWVGGHLAELQAAGVADDTIVVYFGDHGIGLPRGKRSAMDSGLRVPLIVFVPERFRHLMPEATPAGARNERLMGFVDLAPTMLALAGLDAPAYMQGGAFLGSRAAPPAEYLHGFRGRMDGRIDLVRSVRDARYVYVRNYMPHRPAGQYVDYMFQTPMTVAWKRLFDAGGLPPAQAAYWEPRPAEELYDLREDPDEVVNLVASAEHRAILQRLRAAQRRQTLTVRDTGFLPEPEIYARSGIDETGGFVTPDAGSTPWEMARDGSRYPLVEILRVAEQASDTELFAAGELLPALAHADSAVRYWSALGLLIRGKPAMRLAHDRLFVLLDDPAPAVRIAAAEALGTYGDDNDLAAALEVLLAGADWDRRPLYESVMALNALDYLDGRAAGARPRIEALPREKDGTPPALRIFVPHLLDKILIDLSRF